MKGAADASLERYELATYEAYQAAKFNALAQTGKLKALSTYMPKKGSTKKSQAMQAVAFFHRMQAAGIAVKITRTPRAVSPQQ